jgi:methylenetetrahydrofolate reductase (NADPH)
MSHRARISDLLREGRQLRSIEVFPPKTSEGVVQLLDHLEKLKVLRPDFISVTYGAGGSTRERSLEVLEKILQRSSIPVVAHFTCVGSDKAFVTSFVERLRSLGVNNILALRGDPPKDQPDFDFGAQPFSCARDLVLFLKEQSDFCILVAGYPEGHTQAPSREADWDHLREKIEAGGEAVVTQLFFDNADYFRFCDAMRQRGVSAPIIPGVLPLPSIASFRRILEMSQCRVPAELQEIVARHEASPEDFRKASLAFARRQVEGLLRGGAPGIHYYCLNRSELVLELVAGLGVPPSVAT